MNELRKALNDISSIRRQMALSTTFHGYGPVTLACTGGFAILAASVQAFRINDPENQFGSYLILWICTALLSATFIGMQTYRRAHRLHSGMADEMIRMAVEQFLPAAGAGVLLTVVLVHYVPSALWLLPGLWQLIYSLGIFSSCRFLSKTMLIAGAWYLFTGLLCISLADARALSALAMGAPFGVGQFLVATILYFTSEKAQHEA